MATSCNSAGRLPLTALRKHQSPIYHALGRSNLTHLPLYRQLSTTTARLTLTGKPPAGSKYDKKVEHFEPGRMQIWYEDWKEWGEYRKERHRDWKARTTWRTRMIYYIFGPGFLIFAYGCSTLGTVNGFDRRANVLFPYPKFTPCTLIKREIISPTSYILTIRPRIGPRNKDKAKPYEQYWKKGTWSLEIAQPELQIARLYTPLPPIEGDPGSDLRFLIRKAPGGEVSRYLARAPPGANIPVRGPHGGIEFSPNVKEVLFLAGGTGIATALQAAHSLLEQEQERANIHIIWANRKREDCKGAVDLKSSQSPHETEGTGRMVQDLVALHQRHPDRVQVEYLVDEEGTFINESKIRTLTRLGGFTDTDELKSKLIIVSGPDGFVNYLTGPGTFVDGRATKSVAGGLLGKMNISGWEIWRH